MRSGCLRRKWMLLLKLLWKIWGYVDAESIVISWLLTTSFSKNDTQLVSILYRTHKSLPTVSKVSSLYIFDALSRAAKHHVVKHGITGDDYTQPGNCATFLLKVGGVVEGLFQDMVTSGSSESKVSQLKFLTILSQRATSSGFSMTAHLRWRVV